MWLEGNRVNPGGRCVRNNLQKRTKRLVDKYRDNPVLKSLITTLDNARPDLFRYVINERVASTNNAAERGLRELVIHRKLRGVIRSLETMITWENIFICAATWKAQNKDIRTELEKYL